MKPDPEWDISSPNIPQAPQPYEIQCDCGHNGTGTDWARSANLKRTDNGYPICPQCQGILESHVVWWAGKPKRKGKIVLMTKDGDWQRLLRRASQPTKQEN